jgi:hypothetical protein
MTSVLDADQESFHIPISTRDANEGNSKSLKNKIHARD